MWKMRFIDAGSAVEPSSIIRSCNAVTGGVTGSIEKIAADALISGIGISEPGNGDIDRIADNDLGIADGDPDGIASTSGQRAKNAAHQETPAPEIAHTVAATLTTVATP